nr:hypothetical protein CoNPh38_CDS0349 [Staphylococcus phage S-CoN_Ph38]
MISLDIKTLINNGRNKETNNLKEFLKQVVSEIDSEVRSLLQNNDYIYSRVTDDITTEFVHKELNNRYKSLVRRLVTVKESNESIKIIDFHVKNNDTIYKVDNVLLNEDRINNFWLDLSIQKHPYNIESMRINLREYPKSISIESSLLIHVH